MITIVYGTETGNAELVACDIQEELQANDIEAECLDMSDVDASTVTDMDLLVVVCSTYGDGELPASSQDFFEQLEANSPDLSALNFASFGLGDSYYETFNHGIEIFENKLTELGAKKIGDRGEHDASTGSIPTDQAISWISEVLLPWVQANKAVTA